MSFIARTRLPLLARSLPPRAARGLSTTPEPSKTRLARLGDSAINVGAIAFGITISNWFLGAPPQADVKALSADLEVLNERVEKLMRKAGMDPSQETRQ